MTDQTHDLDASTTDARPFRPDTTPSSPCTEADWKSFAADILDKLLAGGHERWSHRIIPGAMPLKPSTPKSPAPRKKMSGPDRSGWHDADDIDSMLDEIATEDFGPLLPPSTKREDTTPRRYLPQAAAAIVAAQLARQFKSATELRHALCVPGAVIHLATSAPELEDITFKALEVLIESEGPCASLSTPRLFCLDDAMASASKSKPEVLGAFDAGFRNSLIESQTIIVLAPKHQPLPPALSALITHRIALPEIDAAMLPEILAQLFPDTAPVTLDEDDLAIMNASPEALTLCARADSPEMALAQLRARSERVVADGPGLIDFPLAPDVRAPLDQLIADMQDWGVGKIGWSDVQRGLLFVGPPGCGKTEIPRLIARSVDIPVLPGSMAAWQADGSRASEICRVMRQFFNKARAMAPCVLFIDELDTFGDRARPHDQNSTWTDMVIGALLECLDGFNELEGVVVIAATNHLYKIDAALRRPGRFDRLVSIEHPSLELLPQAFRWHLRDDLDGVDLTEAAMAAAGMSGAEIAATVREARAIARRRKTPLTLGDLMTAIRNRRPRVDAALHWRIAVHECGHAISGHLVGRAIPKLLTINGVGGDATMLRRSCAGTKADYENDLILLLAGRAAERLVLREPSGGSGGDERSDLAQATTIATAIETSYGLGASGTVWQASPEQAVERLRFDGPLRDRVQAHLQKAEAEATRILKDNRTLLEAMAKTLSAQGVLTGQPLRDYLDQLREAPSVATSSDEPSQPSLIKKTVADQDNMNVS
ncbi:AAA family ATPase [Natronohydrobacter thiooxidans]|uniref:AAA family ATPase n=1 Tax=Natronohydrobacter thiooxidans TaxID=87172 RepID=UPI0008FF7321|nr:AAA family ATPase [Natronohydrobacter thiooxidans]